MTSIEVIFTDFELERSTIPLEKMLSLQGIDLQRSYSHIVLANRAAHLYVQPSNNATERYHASQTTEEELA